MAGQLTKSAILIAIAGLLLCLEMLFGQQALAQSGLVKDGQIVKEATLVADGRRAALYQHGEPIDPALVNVLEAAIDSIERTLKLKFFTAQPESKIQVFVSDKVAVAHVWNGYRHVNDPRPILFLPARIIPGIMRGQNATHIHELTHLMMWNYSSHTLREGLADFVSLSICPGCTIGPNNYSSRAPSVFHEVEEFLGSAKSAPQWVISDQMRRRAYYYASYKFVSSLIALKGMATFLEFYGAPDPEESIQRYYGMSREEAARASLYGR